MTATSAFTWIDYTFFILMLVFSTLVGIYYGFMKKQNTATDYLLGGKEMNIWPMATSIISSSLSGIALISFPADIYRHGITFSMMAPLTIVIMLIAYYITLPVFYKLQVTSIYEYLTERFDGKVRIFASVLYTIHQIFSIPIQIYVPALTLSQVTGINVHYITPIVCGVCIFYTTLGGMKGIVWADSIQFVIMFGTVVIMSSVGTWLLGGFGPIFEKAAEGERLDISFEFTLLKRDTFWAGLAVSALMVNHYATNQSFIQKCLSLPSYKSIRNTLILSTIGLVTVKILCYFTGLIMYARYFDCDPLKSKAIKNYDQLVPMYITENINYIPGFAGLFLSGIFSTTFSYLAAGMNGLATTIYKDFIAPFIREDQSQERISLHLKLLVIVIGIISTASVFIVEKLGSLVTLAFSLSSITAGPLLGLFCVGMLIPKVNSKGALYGGIVSLMFMIFTIMPSQWYKLNGMIKDVVLPVSIDGCNGTLLNETISNGVSIGLIENTIPPEEPLAIFKISFYFYSLIGALTVVIMGILISYCTKDDKPLNKDCITPVMHFLVPGDKKIDNVYHKIDKALEIINKN